MSLPRQSSASPPGRILSRQSSNNSLKAAAAGITAAAAAASNSNNNNSSNNMMMNPLAGRVTASNSGSNFMNGNPDDQTNTMIDAFKNGIAAADVNAADHGDNSGSSQRSIGRGGGGGAGVSGESSGVYDHSATNLASGLSHHDSHESLPRILSPGGNLQRFNSGTMMMLPNGLKSTSPPINVVNNNNQTHQNNSNNFRNRRICASNSDLSDINTKSSGTPARTSSPLTNSNNNVNNTNFRQSQQQLSASLSHNRPPAIDTCPNASHSNNLCPNYNNNDDIQSKENCNNNNNYGSPISPADTNAPPWFGRRGSDDNDTCHPNNNNNNNDDDDECNKSKRARNCCLCCASKDHELGCSLPDDKRDWAEYYRAPKGVGILLSPYLKFLATKGIWWHFLSGLFGVGLLIAALCIFLLDDTARNSMDLTKVILISVFIGIPIFVIVQLTHRTLTATTTVDHYASIALQHTIINALTQQPYTVYLTGLRQTDARILWAADSLSNAAPFLDQTFIQTVCRGPPDDYETVVAAAQADAEARGDLDEDGAPQFDFRRASHFFGGGGGGGESNTANNACVGNPRRIVRVSAGANGDQSPLTTPTRVVNPLGPNALLAHNSPKVLDGTATGFDFAEQIRLAQEAEARRHNNNNNNRRQNHFEEAGDDMDSDLSSISESDDGDQEHRDGSTNSTSRSHSRAPSVPLAAVPAPPMIITHQSSHNLVGDEVHESGSSQLSSIRSTSTTNSVNNPQSPIMVIAGSSSSSQTMNNNINNNNNTGRNTSLGVGGFAVGGGGGARSPLPSFRCESSVGVEVNDGSENHNSNKSKTSSMLSKHRSSIKTISFANRAVSAFQTSKVPYQNSTSPKTVVVAHFAFYYNRHGPQRPPPPMSAEHIVKEFVTTSIQCVQNYHGQVFSVSPNAVVGYWEVGAPVMTTSHNSATTPSPGRNNNNNNTMIGEASVRPVLTSALTCEFNACCAAKEFANFMKSYKSRVLNQFYNNNHQHSNNNNNNFITADTPMTALSPQSFFGNNNNNKKSDQSKSFMARAPSTEPSSTKNNNSNNNPSMSERDPSAVAILARSSFTVGLSKGSVLKGNIGTQTKLTQQLFGPVVQKAAILAEVGVKVQASVVLPQSIYVQNNMTFKMRPIEDIEVPKFLGENKLNGRSVGGGGGGGGGGGAGARVIAHSDSQQQNNNNNLNKVATGSPHGTAFSQNNNMGFSLSLASSSINGLNQSASPNSSYNSGSNNNNNNNAVKASASSSPSRVSVILAHRQQQQNSGLYDIESVYQLLCVGTSNSNGRGNNGGGGGRGGGGRSDDQESEWMYQLERHGGEQLHLMASAFDAFKVGNFQTAFDLYNSLANKANEANYFDRHVNMRLKLCQPFHHHNQPNSASANIIGNNAALNHSGQSQRSESRNNNNGIVSNQIGDQPQQPVQFTDNSSLTLNGESAAVLNALADIHRGSTNNNNSNNNGSSLQNPKRIALESYFSEIKNNGEKYCRKIHLTGVDDFVFE